MQILPVIDVKDGLVVREIAGRRETYQPVQSVLCRDAEPAAVARALVARFGFQQAYLADLNAIAGEEPAWKIYEQVAACGLSLWIDAGLHDVERARALAGLRPHHGRVSAIIAGLESVPGPKALAALWDCVGAERFVFSLDLRDGRPWTQEPSWQQWSPADILEHALCLGIQRYIVLDIAHVGMGCGVRTAPVCQALRRRAPAVQIATGGGVRSMDDVVAAGQWGCDLVLVASALHDGRIPV